jgi:beta-glucosidase
VHLAPGECRTVTFRLSTEQLAYVDVDYRRVVEPGTVRLFVGRSAVDASLAADIALVGPVVELVERRDYLTPSTVE